MIEATRRLVRSSLAAALAVGVPAVVQASDRGFFEQVQGNWSGPGEIVAGKYKGTKFVCNFAGKTPSAVVGMSLDGGCRVGVFSQAMSARVEHGRSGYQGVFLDGAKGKGLDVISGSVRDGTAVFAIRRNQLNGAMRAQMADEETMNVTISVHVDSELVPVIGMTLKRLDTRSVGAVASD